MSDGKTRIWIDRDQLAANRAAYRAGVRTGFSPVFKVKRSTGTVRANAVEIRGPSRMMYDPGGACSSAWVEVDADVEVILT